MSTKQAKFVKEHSSYHSILPVHPDDYSQSFYTDGVNQVIVQAKLDNIIAPLFDVARVIEAALNTTRNAMKVKRLPKGYQAVSYYWLQHVWIAFLTSLRYEPINKITLGIELEVFFKTRDQFSEEQLCQMEMGSAPSKDRTLADEYAGLINLFFQRLRQNLNSPEVKNKIRQRNRTCREAYMGGIELVKNLFSFGSSRLLVIRMDLSLQRSIETLAKNFFKIDQIHSEHDLEYMKQCIELLLKKMDRNALLKDKLGYFLRFEYSIRSGFHIHCFFFYDGNHRHADIKIAEEIARVWNDEVTGGQGFTYICNFNKENYRNCGIGMIQHHDEQKIGHLFEVIKYTCKSDQFFWFSTLNNVRRTQKSQLLKDPYADRPKVGSPRKKLDLDSNPLLNSRTNTMENQVCL